MAKESKGLLSGGLFAKPIMNSRVRTRAVSKKEKILGHLIGPLGLIFVVNTVAALVEKFFTQQVGAMYGTGNVEMIQKMGGYYEVIMTVTKVLGVGLGLLIGFLLSRTKSKQGRFRPWYLIFGFMSIIIGALIFLFPGTTLGESYWYYFFFMLICYNTVGSSFFYTFRDNIVSVSTRDPKEKAQLTFIRKMSWTLISGILIGMLVSSVVLPFWLEKDINGYPILLIVLSVVAIPLFLMEYYYTSERIRADEQQMERVMQNLVSNAVKYSPEGSTVKVRFHRWGKKLVICVKDHGIGISKESQPLIFDQFYTEDKSRSSGNSQGVGLYVVKGIVSEHGGTIYVSSKKGKGSTFYVQLPVEPALNEKISYTGRFDRRPLWQKILWEFFMGWAFASVYRIAKFFETRCISTLIAGILCIGLFPFIWLVDFMSIIVYGRITFLAD